MSTDHPPSGARRRLRPALLGAAVVAGVGLGAAALAGRSETGPGGAPERAQETSSGPGTSAPAPGAVVSPSDPPASPETLAPAPLLAFLGDSLTVGVGAPVDRGYAWQTAELLGWPIAVVDGVSGSGFLAPGGGLPMPDRVDAVVAAGPDVVVVAGGTNDVFGAYDPADVQAAASALLTDLRAGLPDATVVVLGPFPTSLEEVAAPSPTRDAVRAAAEAGGAEFVDAVEIVASVVTSDADWDRYVSADGLHPNEVGYGVLAGALAARLRALVDLAPALR